MTSRVRKAPKTLNTKGKRAAIDRADLLAAISENAAEALRVDSDKFAIIAEARAAGLTYQAIADAYGTNKVTVMRWSKRTSWRVPPAS